MNLRSGRFLFLLAAALFAAAVHAALPDPARAQPQSSFGAHVELGVAQEVTHANEIKLGDGPVLVLEGEPMRKADLFRHVAAGASAEVRCVGQLSCVANADVDSRTGTRSNEFDIAIAEADAGLRYSAGTATYGLRGGIQHWDVGGQSFRRVNDVVAEAVAALGKQLSAYASLSAARYEHPGDNSFLDADYRAVTANLRWASGDGWQSAYSLQATLSREDNRHDDPSLDVKGVLVRASWEAKPAEGWVLRPAFMVQTLHYGGLDPVLGVQRDDRYLSAELVVMRRITADMQLRFEAIRARYRSNAELLNNDWSSVGLGLQWEF